MNLIEGVITVAKLPFVAMAKTILTLMNIVPLPIYEVFGISGTQEDGPRKAYRSVHVKVKGERRLHLGTATIAYLRGCIFKAHINTSGSWCWGVYSEDYLDIQNKWIW